MSIWFGSKTRDAVQRDKSLAKPECEAQIRIMTRIVKENGRIKRGKLFMLWSAECNVGESTARKIAPLMTDKNDDIIFSRGEREYIFNNQVENNKINNNKNEKKNIIIKNTSLSLLTIDEDNRVFYGDSRDE
jgi:hypothetical protein